MTDDTQIDNFTTFEMRARQMRAQAVRDGLIALRRAVTDVFASLSTTGRKPA